MISVLNAHITIFKKKSERKTGASFMKRIRVIKLNKVIILLISFLLLCPSILIAEDQEEALLEVETIPTSLGKLDYLASHVITVICHNLII